MGAIIYPIPRWLKYVADTVLLLLPRRTREKFVMLSEEEELLEKTGMSQDELPEFLKGGLEAIKARRDQALQDKNRLAQMPEEFQEAVAQSDQDVQVLMTQAAC